MTDPSTLRLTGRTAAILLAFTLVFTAFMALTHRATEGPIAASANDAKMRLIGELLPADSYDNVLLNDWVAVPPAPALGLSEPSRAYRARRGGEPAALVLEAAAPDGYSGRIRLIIAVGADGRVAGVRVTEHRETPGLGDYIEPRKDRNKARPWITQFDRIGFAQVAPAAWTVKKDGGRFDYVSGATITARAVSRAVGRALRFAVDNRDKLYATSTGSSLLTP